MRGITPLMLIALTIVTLGIGTVLAGEVSIPNSFTANTPAVASEVNDNFTAVETAVNDNDIRRTFYSYSGQDSDSTISLTYELLRTVGTFTKSKTNTDLMVTWTGHARMAGTAGSNFCDFQVRIDGSAPEGSNSGDGRAVLYTNDAPFSKTALFQGYASGLRSVSIWVRGSATSCTLNPGNFAQQVLIEEISPVDESTIQTPLTKKEDESMVNGIKY